MEGEKRNILRGRREILGGENSFSTRKRRQFQESRAISGGVQEPLTAWSTVLQLRVTSFCRKGEVVAVAIQSLQGIFEVVYIRSWILGCYVPDGAAEDWVDKVLLVKEHALVVGALALVVEREDTRVFLAKKVGALCLSTDSVIRR